MLSAPSAFAERFGTRMARSNEGHAADWLELVLPIQRASLDEGFALLVRELRAGRRYDDILSAILIAGVRDIKPSPVGFKLHACMVIESARALSYASLDREAMLPLFFAMHDLKASQEIDRQEDDWELGPAPDTKALRSEDAPQRWEDALLAWDLDAADRAATLIAAAPVTAASFEAVWLASMRDFHNVGHKPIYATQLERMAVRWKEPASAPVLRTLSMGLLEDGPDAPAIEHFTANRERARDMPKDWERGAERIDAVFTLLETLRTATPSGAVDRGVELLSEGVAPASLWTGIALHASEVLLRAPSLLPVHALTSTQAFRHIFNTSQRETTRAIALLQALAWAPLYRERLASLVREDSRARRIDDAEARAVAPSTSDRGDLWERLRSGLLQQMSEHHQLKYAAALMDELRMAPSEVASLHLAAAQRYLPRAGGDGGAITQLAKRALAN